MTMRQAAAARIQGKIAGAEVSWKFGHASFETGEKVFCFITRDGDLAMKLPAERTQSLIRSGDAKPLRMGERTMREWVVAPGDDSPATLKLLGEAKAYVESLPKAERKRKTAADADNAGAKNASVPRKKAPGKKFST